jgi:hypothetical protein
MKIQNRVSGVKQVPVLLIPIDPPETMRPTGLESVLDQSTSSAGRARSLMRDRESWYLRRGNSGFSWLHLGVGVGGLALIVLGAVLPDFLGSWVLSLFLLPLGALLCAGLAWVVREREFSPQVNIGFVIVGIGVLAITLVSLWTAPPFYGVGVSGPRPTFRLPPWRELLLLHLVWTVVAIISAVGIRLLARPSVERDLAVGLAVFALYPAIALLTFVLDGVVG